jgi:peptidoglycan LD-endopeptidase LytH
MTRKYILIFLSFFVLGGCIVETSPTGNVSTTPSPQLNANVDRSSNSTVENPPEPAIDEPPTSASPSPTKDLSTGEPVISSNLIIPVVGIRPDDLRDTYNQSRSEGRVHNAIDIMAPRGTPVVAATSGKILKLFTSEKGGITIYQLDPDNTTVYYYAHLDRYADNLSEGHVAKQGEVIGYVGDTGNSGAGNYHLHFAIWKISDPKHYWDGENVNPYPLLRGNKK